MRGVVFDLSLTRYAAAKALGKWVPALYHGAPSCLRLADDVPEPRKPGPGWHALAPVLTGFCGSDLAVIFLKYSPAMSPFSSSPSVLGHEILGRLLEPAGALREGDRVVVDPVLHCALRGVDPVCPSCARGDTGTCESFARGHLAPGMSIGFHRDLPGGFGEKVVAHESQLFRVPDSVPDGLAVLVEPLAVATHAVFKRPPGPPDRVLVIGGGMIAFSILAAMRLLDLHPHNATLLAWLDYQGDVGRSLGATDVVVASRGTAHVVEEIQRITGALPHAPVIGPPVLVGGYDVVFDCIGSAESLTNAMRFARAGATIVLVGNAGVLPGLDWSNVWARELRIAGTIFYGREAADAARRRTFEIVLDRLTDAALAAPIASLVTHEFPLEKYRDAVVANVDREKFRSIKTVFRLGESS